MPHTHSVVDGQSELLTRSRCDLKAPLFISLIGAECTGKTLQAQQLAAAFGGVVVSEGLRHWCEAHGRTPTAPEQAALLQAQIEKENQALVRMEKRPDAVIFCDTCPLLTAVYSQHYFADSSLLRAAQAHHQRYALTLWLQPDLPWVADGLQRDGLVAQAAVQSLLAQQLARQSRVVRISGSGRTRFASAHAAVQAVAAPKAPP